MATYLLDTNHLGAALDKVSPLRERILQAGKAGARFATCWPVLCELEAGIVGTRDPERNRRTLNFILESVVIWPFDWPVVRGYGELASGLVKRGLVLSSVDITLAALAIGNKSILLTTDHDFQALPQIRIENWLSVQSNT